MTEQRDRLQRLEAELHTTVTMWRLYPEVEAVQAHLQLRLEKVSTEVRVIAWAIAGTVPIAP